MYAFDAHSKQPPVSSLSRGIRFLPGGDGCPSDDDRRTFGDGRIIPEERLRFRGVVALEVVSPPIGDGLVTEFHLDPVRALPGWHGHLIMHAVGAAEERG